MSPKALESRKKRMDERWQDLKYRRVSYWKELEENNNT